MNRNIDEEKVIELYKEKTIKSIAAIMNTYPEKISNILKKNGIKPKTKFNGWKKVNDVFFDEIDTEEKAYILGFFVADGCIRLEKDKDGEITHSRLTFSNSIDDEEIINHIHRVICPENKILYTHNTKDGANRKPQIILQWTSKHMKDVLVNKYKIIPKKTYDGDFEIPLDTIPEKLFRHFIRGFIDGDGNFNKGELRFVANSDKFALQIIKFFEKKFKEYGDLVDNFKYSIYKINGKTVTYYRVRLPMGSGRKNLYKKLLYENATIFLNRKKNKFDSLWKKKY